jgi:hypothetical protein
MDDDAEPQMCDECNTYTTRRITVLSQGVFMRPPSALHAREATPAACCCRTSRSAAAAAAAVVIAASAGM